MKPAEVREVRAHPIQPALSFEYLAWIFARLSGVALIVMAAVGLIGALAVGAWARLDLPTLLRWAFFPNPNHVASSDLPELARAWGSGFWQIVQLLIAVFASAHGFNGLRVVVEDFTGRSALLPLLRGLIFLLWLFTLIAAFYVILAA